MAGLPVLPGAAQAISRLVLEFAVPATLGAAGAAGGSFTSVTPIVTVTVPVPPLASSASIVTS